MSVTVEEKLAHAKSHLEAAQAAQRAKLAGEQRDQAFNQLLFACAYLVDAIEALRRDLPDEVAASIERGLEIVV